MKYTITGSSKQKKEGVLHFKNAETSFGITKETDGVLSSPADIYLGALAACILKNIERFSGMMKFTYEDATIEVSAAHTLNPSRLEQIVYEAVIRSKENNINTSLLKRNLEKHGTIYYMIAQSCAISGSVVHLE
jgi:uncharacterized OsmC-like protein